MIQSLPSYLLPAIFGFVAGGVFFVFLMSLLEQRGRQSKKPGPRLVRMPCPDCSRELIIHKNELTPLSAAETGLIVSALGADVGKRLGEYRCPHCRASHVFGLETSPPRYLTSDAFEPRPSGTYCVNCHKPLVRPAWPAGAYDGRISAAPNLQPQHGLVCSRCNAICCVQCVRDTTRNRTKDGSFLCPRCFRAPVDRFHHF